VPWQVIFQQVAKFFFYLFEVRFIYPKGIVGIEGYYFNVHVHKILQRQMANVGDVGERNN
jgi:cyclophilin family peptidyl-prolyl cis-trans isomerase